MNWNKKSNFPVGNALPPAYQPPHWSISWRTNSLISHWSVYRLGHGCTCLQSFQTHWHVFKSNRNKHKWLTNWTNSTMEIGNLIKFINYSPAFSAMGCRHHHHGMPPAPPKHLSLQLFAQNREDSASMFKNWLPYWSYTATSMPLAIHNSMKCKH